MQRVAVYTIPVFIIAALINIPKFMETEIVIGQAVEIHNTSEKPIEYNITTYTIDVTDLRYVQSVKSIYI